MSPEDSGSAGLGLGLGLGEGATGSSVSSGGRERLTTISGLRRAGGGIGTQVMRHRADSIGAELTIDSKRGKGVVVTCTVRRNP